jgi:putative ABC transport system ATP-binding protein
LLHKGHQQGGAIAMVTHEPDIAQHAKRVICVRDGKVISDSREGYSPCLDRKMLAGEKIQ